MEIKKSDLKFVIRILYLGTSCFEPEVDTVVEAVIWLFDCGAEIKTDRRVRSISFELRSGLLFTHELTLY